MTNKKTVTWHRDGTVTHYDRPGKVWIRESAHKVPEYAYSQWSSADQDRRYTIDRKTTGYRAIAVRGKVCRNERNGRFKRCR